MNAFLYLTETVPIPEGAQSLYPESTGDFWQGLGEIFSKVLSLLDGELSGALSCCGAILVVCVLCSLFRLAPFAKGQQAAELCGAAAIGAICLGDTASLFSLGADTVISLCEYAGVLMPVLTASLAGSGMVSSAGGMYAGTILVTQILSQGVRSLLFPLLRCYLALGFAGSFVSDELFSKLRDLIKSLLTWGLKGVLYAFSGYMMLTRVISGAADKTAVKAAKVALSSVVPVIGSLLSDSSETLVLSADLLRGTLGVGGMLAVVALCAGPFVRLGVRYLILKATAALAQVVGSKNHAGLVDTLSTAMGLNLAVTGVCCMILLIACVCFMKGAGG